MSARNEFRKRKRFNLKKKRDSQFKMLSNLFKLNKEDFWRKVKSLSKRSQTVNVEIDKIKTEYEKVFNSSNCSSEQIEAKLKEINEFKRIHSSRSFDFKIEECLISETIGDLKNGNATSIRNVTNEMLKYCASQQLVHVLRRLFEIIVNEQVQPLGFNMSILKPIIKCDTKPSDDINNTRPFAISDCIQNFFEKILLSKINDKHRQHRQQFGFKSNSSCSHAVFVINQVINYCRSRKNLLYTSAVDASKAFDKVSRPHLWLKLI